MGKYEEALSKARAGKPLEEIFPEMKESERVRKEIIHYILYKADGVSEKQEHEWVAWLEKHKINTEGNFDRGFCYGYDCGYQAGYAIAKNEMKPKVAHASLDSEKQKEQKGANGNEREIPNEQKPAGWSEEDERMRNQLVYDVEYQKKEGLVSAKKNKVTKALYKGLEECYDEKIAWIKSLRPPQYCENCKLKRSVENWKPSKVQIGTLKQWLQDHELDGDSRYVYPVFYSLLTDLQKLS